MTNAIDNAIARIQDIALAMTSVSIKSAPDYAIENADPCPFSVAWVGSGTFRATNATQMHNFPAINVEFHFSRINLKQTYQQINAVVYEFSSRLAADPTLNGTVMTIVFGQDAEIAYTVRPMEWGKVTTQMLMFTVPVKILQTPQTTA